MWCDGLDLVVVWENASLFVLGVSLSLGQAVYGWGSCFSAKCTI